MSTNEQMLEELKKIREALVPPPSPPPEKKNLWEEFKEFLDQYKVLGLAVAFIMGIYLGRLVQQLVSSFITPILSLIFVSIGWESTLIGFTPTLFIQELITFIIVAFVIFIIVKLTKRLGIK
ncbi:MAG: MscL family protein [Candidatus Thorarchaeota archaeon]